MSVDRRLSQIALTSIVAFEAVSCGASNYEVTTINSVDVDTALSRSFPMMRGSVISDLVKSKAEIDSRNQIVEKFDAAIRADSLNREITFNHDGYEAHFFVDADFEAPTEKQLVDMWNLIKEESWAPTDMVAGQKMKRFNPVNRANFFIGNFGKTQEMWSFTLVRDFPTNTVSDSMVNMDNALIRKGDPFWVEYCQSLLIGAKFAQKDQEVICNQVGIAAYAAKKGMSYSDYKRIAEVDGSVTGLEGVRKIELKAYSEQTYDEVLNIFKSVRSSQEVDQYLSKIKDITHGHQENERYFGEQAQKFGAKL